MLLTDDEIRELTGRERRPAQVRQLNAMGIAFKQRADRSIVVLRAHVDQVLGAPVPARQRAARPAQINWEG